VGTITAICIYNQEFVFVPTPKLVPLIKLPLV
jgi:hypothetical protein